MTDVQTLIDAAKAGDTAKVEELLHTNPELAAGRLPDGESPIMSALYRGHRNVVDALLRGRAPIDVFAAAALGRLDDLRSVLQASPAHANGYAYDGWTALHLAAFFGQREAAEILLAAGAALQAVSRNSIHNTPLHAAVAGGHVDASLFLIQRGADVNVPDHGGHTPLHIAAEAGYVPIVEALLARGADPHAVDLEDKTPLSRAVAKHHIKIVDLINKEH